MKLLKLFTAGMVFFCLSNFKPSFSQTVPFRSVMPPQPSALRTITAAEWIKGAMPDTTGSGTPTTDILKKLVIPNTNLQPLGVTLGGPPLIVSNNPERFTGDGWLFQHSFKDAKQGGVDYPMRGATRIYMFHLNFTSPGTTKYVSLVVHNPSASSILYTFKGAHYTNVDKPLTGGATGQSYWVSRDWISNTPTITVGQINANSKHVLFTKQVNSGNMFDGLYEVSTAGPVYYYTVVTSSSNVSTVRSAASVGTPHASFAAPPDPRVTQSDYRMETSGTYARGAGVFTASEVTADNVLVVPDVPSRIGFCFNTSNKFYPMLEKQTPAVVVKTAPTTDTVRSIYSSSHNYGAYGMYFNTVFHLQNNNSAPKTVNVYFAENENLVDGSSASGRWNSRFKVDGVASAAYDVYIQGNNPRKLLKTLTVPGGTTDFSLEVYIPGLITTNHQLIFETVTTVPITLPVTLISFEGKTTQGVNSLIWKTEQEFQLSHYTVERKINDATYAPVATIKAVNNGQPQQYHYDDVSASATGGKKYYRLKMINDDGSYKYSSVVSLENKVDYLLKTAGNPFQNELRLQWTGDRNNNATIKLISTNGAVVYYGKARSNEGFNQFTVSSLQHLKPGAYVVELSINNHSQFISVVKQ
jgi:hypothetical protein